MDQTAIPIFIMDHHMDIYYEIFGLLNKSRKVALYNHLEQIIQKRITMERPNEFLDKY